MIRDKPKHSSSPLSYFSYAHTFMDFPPGRSNVYPAACKAKVKIITGKSGYIISELLQHMITYKNKL